MGAGDNGRSRLVADDASRRDKEERPRQLSFDVNTMAGRTNGRRTAGRDRRS
jgi:hypothetical protein